MTSRRSAVGARLTGSGPVSPPSPTNPGGLLHRSDAAPSVTVLPARLRAMPAVRTRLRSEARTRFTAWLGLTVLLGVVGGVVLSAAAGARRTDTAYPRLLASNHAADVLISPSGTGLTGYDDALARLGDVETVAKAALLNVILPAPGSRMDRNSYVASTASAPPVAAGVGVDGRLGQSMDRVKVLEGRRVDRGRADEVMIDPQLADRYRLHPGGTLRLFGVPSDFHGNPDLARIFPLALRVVGVVVFDNQVVPVSELDKAPMFVLSPAFFRTAPARSMVGADGAYIRLRPGTNLAGFSRQAQALAQRFPDTNGGIFVADLADHYAKVERAIQPEAVALGLFALLAGFIGLVVITQILSRQVVLDAADYPVLSALGMDRGQLVTLSMIRVAGVCLVGALLAVVVAVATSPLMPLGPARLAEPRPGLEVNLAILSVGLLVMVVVPAALVLPVAWRVAARRALPGTARDQELTERPSRVAAALASFGRPLAASTGVRMAFEPGRGRTAVPVRSAIVGTTLALVALVASLVFGSSLNRLVNTPRLYGQTWDAVFNLGFGAIPAADASRILHSVPGVEAYSGGDYGLVDLPGRQVAAIGVDPLDGAVGPTLLAGRQPSSAEEIALGARTLRQLHAHVGDWVRVGVDGGTATRRHVVGEVVFPAFGVGSFTPTGLGEGAELTASQLPQGGNGCVPPGQPPAASGVSAAPAGTCYSFFLIRLAPGANMHVLSTRFVSAANASGCPPGQCTFSTQQRPADIDNYRRVLATPLVLGGMLTLLAVATLAHVLVTSIRRRRRDLAVLKTIGFVRRQISATVAWQSTALAVVALAVGLPLGVAAGRLAWALFANSVGVANDADVPLVAVFAAIPITVVVANLLAAGPGWRAGRVKPASVLRSE